MLYCSLMNSKNNLYFWQTIPLKLSALQGTFQDQETQAMDILIRSEKNGAGVSSETLGVTRR